MPDPTYRYLIVIPARNERECIGETLSELIEFLPEHFRIAVGLNACEDDTENICREFETVYIGKSREAGYGYGCAAAITAAAEAGYVPNAYLFFAADGANSPQDLRRLCSVFEASHGASPFIMGLRRFRLESWASEFGRALPNLILGLICKSMGGQFFHDLGPLRLIERSLLEKLQLKEMVWGWTVEAQIRAAQLGVSIYTISVEESPRRAGKQKVSGVSLWQSSRIGWEIAKAAWRCRRRDK